VRKKRVMGARERTSAKNYGADRACRGGIVNAGESAPGLLVDRHFRNDGDAHSRSHHAEKAAELAALKNNLRMEAGAVARRDGGVAEAVAVAKQQKGLGAEVFQRESAALGQFVVPRQRGKERLREQRERFEFMAANGQSEDGQIDFAGTQEIEEGWRDFFDDGQLDLRIFSRKSRETLRKKIRRDGGDDADRDGACHRVFLLGDVTTGGFELAENSAGPREKRLPCLREADRPAKAVEEASAKFILEFHNLLREGWLRHV